MFRTAELSQKVSKAEYKQTVPALRKRLFDPQARLHEANFPVIVLFAGVDGAGKGEVANLLSEWMDPRSIVTRAFAAPSDEDWRNRERWDRHEVTVHDMVERSSTQFAPWHLIEANDKRFARVKVLETVCDRLAASLREEG